METIFTTFYIAKNIVSSNEWDDALESEVFVMWWGGTLVMLGNVGYGVLPPKILNSHFLHYAIF